MYIKFKEEYLSYEVDQVLKTTEANGNRLVALGVATESDKKSFDAWNKANPVINPIKIAGAKKDPCENCKDGSPCPECDKKKEAENVTK